jgi:hypothetical protein
MISWQQMIMTVLDNGGGLVSNANAEMTFIECVNNTTVDVIKVVANRRKEKMFFIHLILCGQRTQYNSDQ